jgi:ferredoxin-NADP reductase
VPLEFQAGQYIHRVDLETATIVRAYSRKLADNREYVATIEA